MAGCPIRRARKAAVRDDAGHVIAFPHMPRAAELPRGWRHWSPAEKIEFLLNMSLDQAHYILSWPAAELDPHRLAVQAQVRHVMFMIGLKALLDGRLGREAARDRNRERLLAEMTRREFGGGDTA